jgi:hypothetical protein
MGGADQELRVNDLIATADNVFDTHRVHMMNDDPVEDVETLDPEITAQVSSDNVVADKPPLSRPVELLIHPAIVAERC